MTGKEAHASYMREYRLRPEAQRKHREEASRWQREHPDQAKARNARYRARHRTPRPTPEQRFWAKVARNEEGCWTWTASLSTSGYGQIRWGEKTLRAHRVAWFLTFGRWPDGSLLHACDNPICVRPDHLREGTQRENLLDASRKGRIRNQHGLAPSKEYW